ncbi:hypothetical protein G7Y79_00002g008400 [Physcia stellaris]|nr:hypothetical protein G7Y79_00002g008400 [Physcia stellaris]
MEKPRWNRVSGGYRPPETQVSGIAVVVDNKTSQWRRKHLQDEQESQMPATDASKISSTEPSSFERVRPPLAATTQSTRDAAPHEKKSKNNPLGCAITTVAAHAPAKSSSSAILSERVTDKVSKKRRHERRTSELSIVPEASSNVHKKRKKTTSRSRPLKNRSAAKARLGESPYGTETALATGLAASSSSALHKPSERKKSKDKGKNGTLSGAPTPSTSCIPQQPAVKPRVSGSSNLTDADNDEGASSSLRRKKSETVPQLNIVDIEWPEPFTLSQCSTPEKKKFSSGGKRKRRGTDRDSSTAPSARKKSKQSEATAKPSKKSFPKVGSSEAGPSRQNKGKGKEVVTSPIVWTDNGCADPLVFDCFPDNGFADFVDEPSALSNKAARNRREESNFPVNPSRFRSQTMPPPSSFNSTRPSLRDSLGLDRGDFMGALITTLNDRYIKEVVTQSFDELQRSSQSTAPAGVTSGPPPPLASATHHEILQYYGARREPFTEDQLVEIIRNPMLSGLKRNKVAEDAFSTNGSVKASYRHLQARLTEAEWAKVAPKQKRHKDRDRLG